MMISNSERYQQQQQKTVHDTIRYDMIKHRQMVIKYCKINFTIRIVYMAYGNYMATHTHSHTQQN